MPENERRRIKKLKEDQQKGLSMSLILITIIDLMVNWLDRMTESRII
jgi:hypothetical protein